MQDRQPGAPGQYKATLTPAEFQKMQAGEQFTITMVRDDQPIVEGTPYSKAAVLPDDLAAIICPDVLNPSPADAFRALVPRNGKSEMTANLKMGGYKVTGLGKPTSDTDAAPWGMVAPAGFGLGSAQVFSADEINDITAPGFYDCNETMTIGGYERNRWWMDVSAYGAGTSYATQRIKMFWGAHAYTLERSKVNGTYEDWGWGNPPMELGKEYCTTEKYYGKSVWTVLFNAGNFASGGVALTTEFSTSGIIRYSGNCNGFALPIIWDRDLNSAYTLLPQVYVYNSKIRVIVSGGSQFVGKPIYLQVWYTKD